MTQSLPTPIFIAPTLDVPVLSPSSTDVVGPNDASAAPPAPGRFYVYELVDPRTACVFYVGKGSGKRDCNTLSGGNPNKMAVIRSIKAAGLKVIRTHVANGLYEREACRIELERIRHYGFASLTNILPGSRGRYAETLDKASEAINRLVEPADDWPIERKLLRLLVKAQFLQVMLDIKRGYFDRPVES